MTSHLPAPAPRYFIDPEDPRAPSLDVWNAMGPEERNRIAAELPSDFTLDFLPPPEGDHHSIPKNAARDALTRYFHRIGRRVYVSAEIAVYYPGERVFAPDVIAVVDVETHPRDSWLVAKEGKGLDFAMEILVSGDRRKDMKRNVVRYASLGIPEYVVFDQRRGQLHGFRLPAPDARAYEPIPSRTGKLECRVLGLELMLEGDRVRFLVGDASVPEADDLLARLGTELDRVQRNAARLSQDLEDSERRLAEAMAEIERLKGGG